mmetsp:Transcript_59458/g.69497  ORF Transcript_59458/g.69497 Transcript_59458/m.69497 type:complete len:85 (-) Transcript_59458:460-714(-)
MCSVHMISPRAHAAIVQQFCDFFFSSTVTRVSSVPKTIKSIQILDAALISSSQQHPLNTPSYSQRVSSFERGDDVTSYSMRQWT